MSRSLLVAGIVSLFLAASAIGVPQSGGDKVEMTPLRKDVKPFEYVEAKVPFYPPSKKWGVTGEPLNRMQLPLEPAESIKHFVTPVGFEVKLFAAEPLIKRPICMNWDERGRLWIAETVDYPNEIKPQGEGRDRIVIVEDTDGDGVADKTTVFADKLSIPTSLAFYKGGVIIQQAPDTLYLRDHDGDGKADERRVLFTGWSTADTHAGPSNLHWGFDNWIWGIVGYSGFQGTVGGEQVSFRTGFYRFRPDGSKIEFLRNTTNNSWGVGFSEEGVLFGSTANGNPSVYLPIPNRYYEAVRGWSSRVLDTIAQDSYFYPITDKVRQVDWHGKFTAAAGHALYTARTYPPAYWNRTAFVTEPTGHLTATFVIKQRGADYQSANRWNLLASDDEWSSPIMAEVGPDGHVWVIDWYNYIVQHNPTPPGWKTGKGNAYETPLRDKKHGRIYRVVYKAAKPAGRTTLAGATPEKLVATLKHDNLFWRKHAQRLLVERGQRDVVPALLALVADPSVDAINLNPGAIHALWTLHGLGVLDGSDAKATAAVIAALKHRSPGVRRNTALVLPRNANGAKALLASGVLDDPDGQVRLSALLALSEMPADLDAGKILVSALQKTENVNDRWLPDALTCAAARHDQGFLHALVASKTRLAERALEVTAVVSQHHARGGPAQTAGALLTALAGAEPRTADVILSGLAKGWPKDRAPALTAALEKTMADLLPRLTLAARGDLFRLATAWGSKALDRHAEEISRALLGIVTDEKQTDDKRIEAARQMIQQRPADAALADQLLAAITARTSPELTAGLIEAAGGSTAPETADALLKRFSRWPPSARAAALRALLVRPASTQTLLDAIDAGKVPLGELTLDQKQALAVHPERGIARRAKELLDRGGGLPSADRQKVIEELLPLVKRGGNSERGQLVFRKHCAACHTHGGEGAHVGPDLTGMAVHPREHLLAEILDPSRSVEGNFRIYTVTTTDGRVLSGLLASESRTAVELIDAEAKKHVLQRDEIDKLAASPKSLMPEGFEKQLTKEELTDLLEFLTRRGRFLPLPLDRVATAVSTRGMFNDEKESSERLVFTDWKPKTFEGVPFHFIDPQGDRVPNVVLLHSSRGTVPPRMPKSVTLPCNAPAKAIHLLSGVSGWGYPQGEKGSITLLVRLHYADGQAEEHPLRNGEHFADYLRRVEVPGSKFAYTLLRGQQLRYLALQPRRPATIASIEFTTGGDRTAPVLMAVTVEAPE